MSFVFSQRSKNNLVGVHPLLVKLMTKALEVVPYDFIVTEGLRTVARQRELVRKGASQTMNSYHMPQADGWGHAVDIALLYKGTVTWENKYYEEEADVILRLAREMFNRSHASITWGGSWKKLYDTPHYQLEPKDGVSGYEQLLNGGE